MFQKNTPRFVCFKVCTGFIDIESLDNNNNSDRTILCFGKHFYSIRITRAREFLIKAQLENVYMVSVCERARARVKT